MSQPSAGGLRKPSLAAQSPLKARGEHPREHWSGRCWSPILVSVDRESWGALEFRILGPLEVIHDGELIALGGARQRALVVLLALRAPSPVSCDRLIDELWGERPPDSALHAIQVYIS